MFQRKQREAFAQHIVEDSLVIKPWFGPHSLHALCPRAHQGARCHCAPKVKHACVEVRIGGAEAGVLRAACAPDARDASAVRVGRAGVEAEWRRADGI